MQNYLVTVIGRRSTAATDLESGKAAVAVAAYTRGDAVAQISRSETVTVTVDGRTTVYDDFIVTAARRIGRHG